MSTPSPPPVLRLAPLVSAATWRWAVLGVATAAAIAWFALTGDPATWRGLALLGGAAVVTLLWLGSRRWEVDVTAGTVTVGHGPLLRRTVRLADVAWVHLVDAGMGVMNLELMPARGATVRLGVLRVNPFVEASREPAVLWTLAEMLERHAPDPGSWPEVLRRQAAHLAQDGEVETSPLAEVTTRGRARGGLATSSAAVLAELDRRAEEERDHP